MKLYSLDIALVCAGMNMTGDMLDAGRSLGGSETAGIQMAETLVRLGHHVQVYCNTDRPHEHNGVIYAPMGWIPNRQGGGFPKGFIDYARMTPFDLLIVQRIPAFLGFELQSKVNFLWQHDLATRSGPSIFHPQMWNIDKILVLSEFMKKQYQQVHGGPDHLYHVTRNGVDLRRIDATPNQERDRYRLTYTARPERGLDILLQRVFPEIIKVEPRAKLYISRYDDPQTLPLYQQLEGLMRQYGERVVNLGNLGKQALYENYKQSRLYLYPSAFEEVSCCVGATLIDTPRDYRKWPDGIPIKNLVGCKDFPVYCYDNENEKITLGTVKWVAKTRTDAPIWKLTLDDGNTLRATPDHRIMLRDGSYKELQHLNPGESLMPLYKHVRIEVNQNNGEWIQEHRLVGQWKAGRALDGHNEHVHHKSGWWSNDPSNLEVLSRSEHFSITHTGRTKTPQQTRKRLASFKLYAESQEGKKALSLTAQKRARLAWEKINSWPEAQRREFFTRRAELRDNSKVSESGKQWWAEFKARPAEEQKAWLKQRSEKIWEARRANAAEYNHKVVSVEPDGFEDVYDMEVDIHHNFVANGIVIHNCITAMETAACGTPFIGPWRAALPETCKDHGVLIRNDGTSPLVTDPVEPGFQNVSDDFCKAMAKKAVELMHDDNKWRELSTRARNAAEKWQWEEVAEDWVKMAHDRIAERTNSPARMVKHFLVHSDVVAAKKYAEKNDSTQLKESVKNYVDRYMPFMNEDAADKRRLAINEFYEQRSGGERANWQTGYYAEQEPRLQALLMFIGEHKDEINTLLDYGCAHGGYARVISNAFPHIKVVGVDNSPSLIRCCEEMKQGVGPDGQPACKYPENLEFAVGDENGYGATLINQLPFDMVVCMEVLEHIPHAEEFAAKLEQHCKPDGWMVWTTPHGRRERDELINKSIPPVHVRAFDMHDLRDLFGHRKNFAVGSFSDLKEIVLDKSFAGWFMTTYRKDDKAIGEIDWERKFFLQGPRETLAICMMTHNSDGVLRRACKSVQKLADQFVIVDNGPSTDATIETALEFTSDVRAGTSPFFCYKHLMTHAQDQIQPGLCDMAGFETPRNESIENIWTDWILWIDSDENLLDAGALFKYLKPNVYYGYAIQQHHLSVDAGKLKVDLPVRLFRNGYDIRFYGKVHEHAEFGINRGMGPDVSVCGDLNLAHDGYIDEEVRRGRFDRNIRLLQCDRLAYPQRTLGKYLYDIRDNIHQARYGFEQNGGNMTAEIRKHLEDAINTYRNEFLNKAEMQTLNVEGLNYYSEALGMLGLGVEVSASVDLKRQGAQAGNPERFRAMDAEEAKKILASKIDMMAQPLMGPYSA